ncbi:helicase-related protein [Agaricicola taiwanensis]|nr:helicase-related protein [Agaricicola taiwanensis]
MAYPAPIPPAQRGRGVTAVLGPTNTGKTHYAIERMLGHSSGIIGLPLRLLAREVYGRLVERAGEEAVALVTGEEKIKPRGARYWVCTIEAMPQDLDVAFVAIDEVQLASDLDRGHVFTDRILRRRGREETLLLGAETMRPLIEKLLPGVTIVTRPRLSQLTFTGAKKVTRLPPRTAIVAFSAEEVYAIAELIRRQRGGAAVVLGALSPRTRNAQVALYQAGEVDYLIATDAIGMGLNLDIDHVAFAGDRKFDGFQFRHLNPAEMGQVAGRAGRYMKDGTFGTTGRCPAIEPELAERLEAHAFDAVRVLQWRNAELKFDSIGSLLESLAIPPQEAGLTRAPTAEDVLVLETLARDPEVRRRARGFGEVRRLWEACQIPDYRKISPAQHADLVTAVYGFIAAKGMIPADWFSTQVARCDRADGDIDTLAARIAQTRTWTFVANRPDWLDDPEHWQAETRAVEDRLSDALHERLTQRFIDRRTSVLMRRLKERTMLEAEISTDGDVTVESHHVGRLAGFQFTPDVNADPEQAKALRAAAQASLTGEFERRAEKLSAAPDPDIVIASDGVIRWLGDPVGKLAAGDKPLSPRIRLLADDTLSAAAREKVEARLALRVKAHVQNLLGPLLALESAEGLEGIARGIAFQLLEGFGVIERAGIAEDVKSLDQTARAALRALGVRFGAYHLYLPALLKPAPRALAAQLYLLHKGVQDTPELGEAMALSASGRTSFPVPAEAPKELYRVLGFRVCGTRAVRVDILERLADLIRPAIAFRPGLTQGEAPAGAAEGDGFTVTVTMTSLVGCAGEDFATILRSLGYRVERKPAPAPVAETAPAASAETGSLDAGPAEATTPDAEPAAEPAADAEAAAAQPEPQEPEAPAAEDVQPAGTEAVPTEITPADPAAEQPAPVEAAPSEPAEPVTAEPAMIEIWHPGRRHDRPARPHGRPQHRNQPREGQSREQQPRDGARRDGARHGEGRADAEGRNQQRARPPRDKKRWETSSPGKGGQQRHADQRRDEPRREPRRERQADPNSPFAALAALKSRLETEGSGNS